MELTATGRDDQSIAMIRHKLALLLLLWSFAFPLAAQSTIAHYAAPGPVLTNPRGADLDGDGQSDFYVTAVEGLVTLDIPASLFSVADDLLTGDQNEYLARDESYFAFGILHSSWKAAFVQKGASIDANGTLDGHWANPPGRAQLSVQTYTRNTNETYDVSWTPPFSTSPDAYLGVRMSLADGWHYGWIRVSSYPNGDTNQVAQSMGFVEWAYETRPNTSILAGAKPVVLPLAAPKIARAGHLRLTWPAETAKAYVIQSKAALSDVKWSNLNTTVIGNGNPASVDLPLTGPSQFFRVVEAD